MEKEKKRLAEQQAKKDLTPLVLQKKDFSLEEYKLEGIDTAYYIPQWITEGTWNPSPLSPSSFITSSWSLEKKDLTHLVGNFSQLLLKN